MRWRQKPVTCVMEEKLLTTTSQIALCKKTNNTGQISRLSMMKTLIDNEGLKAYY